MSMRSIIPVASWEAIDALLPQTQCRQCGFQGCAPYARAIAAGEADINRCPPGDQALVGKLAALTGREEIPLDRSRGEPGPLLQAWIDPQHCIGCTLCIQACPTDAILGMSKRLHQVISQDCTGCGLCVPPCPVDCIEMQPVPDGVSWDAERQQRARELTRAREARLARLRRARETQLASHARVREAAAQALARARARRAGKPEGTA